MQNTLNNYADGIIVNADILLNQTYQMISYVRMRPKLFGQVIKVLS